MDDLIVECYSGHTYAQEPRALTWQGHRYRVVRVEQRWQTPDGPAFRLLMRGGERFELRYHELQDRWLIRTLARAHRKGPKQAKILAFPSRERFAHAKSSNIEDKEVQR